MQSMFMNSPVAEPDHAVNDLGPLAWVLDELRKSLEGAAKALKRFAWDADMARGSDLAAIDASQLRIARQQLHQSVGALEMVGLTQPALVLRAMEAAVQKFVLQPESCSQDAVGKIEYACFALYEYLEGVLAGKPVSAVSLFPQYRDVQELLKADRIHPADLWSFEWRWLEPQMALLPHARHYDVEARSLLDQSVLQLMKGKAPQAARCLRDLSLGFSANQIERQPRVFWLIAAAYFEAVAHDLLGSDIHVRRAASRILLQYASLSRGDTSISERLALDLLFFCAQAVSNRASDTPVLSSVRFAYGLTSFKPVDYEVVQFGRFDPALLAQARKRIVSAKESWSLLCGGETTKAKLVSDLFSLVADSLRRLHPPSEAFVQALALAIESATSTGQVPGIELAMEVATSVLYLEAAFEDLDPGDPELAVRTASLAQRLEQVRMGGAPQPLEGWMETLYRRVSDKQTMGSVVNELRVSLGDLEKSLDEFFRNPQDKSRLQQVPGQLSQMRGVLSVLGLDHACRAVMQMKDTVEQMLDTEIDAQLVSAAGTFEHLGNNLGNLSFLIDMLNYQPALAKKLFVYDEQTSELKPLMGRLPDAADKASLITVNSEMLPPDSALLEPLPMSDLVITGASGTPQINDDAAADADDAAMDGLFFVDPTATAQKDVDALASPAVTSPIDTAATAPVPMALDFADDELLEIFLEEARDVTQHAVQALQALASEPANAEHMTVLRRAFHTLKGSARMVGLAEFGEASWAFEQLLNSWMADQKTASGEFRALCSEALTGLQCWVADIASRQQATWSSTPFCASAQAMLDDSRYQALDLSGQAEVVEQVTASQAGADTELQDVDFDSLFGLTPRIDVKTAEENAVTDAASPDQSGEEPEIAHSPELLSTDQIDETTSAAFIDMPMSAAAALSEPLPEPETLADSLAFVATENEKTEKLSSEEAQENVKIIGDLRIGIALFNVYLGEADEWSRRLVDEVSQWALQTDQPVASSAVALAHSLAGSSATVGFMGLSGMARSLEHALDNSRIHHHHGASSYGKLFVEVAEDIRRLLHEFAAGFLKSPRADLLEQLHELEFSDSVSAQYDQDDAFDFFSEFDASVQATLKADGQAGSSITPVVPAMPVISPLAVDAPEDIRYAAAESLEPSAPVRQLAGHDDIDDIDAVDAIDLDLFPIFEEEGAELMPRLGGALRQWAEAASDQSARLEVLRVLHTLKGSARLAGAMRLGEMAHRMESDIAFVGSDAVDTQDMGALLTHFDTLQATFEALRQHNTDAFAPVLAAAEPVSPMPFKEEEADTKTVQPQDVPLSDAAMPTQIAIESLVPGPQRMVKQPLRQAGNGSIRVRTQLLDRMVNQAGEIMISRSRLESEIGQLRVSLNDMTGSLTRLRQQLRDIELQAETQMQSRLALAKEAQAGFDPLEFDRFTRVQELTRMMAESVNDVATVQRTLQRTVEATEDDLVAQGRQARELQRDLLRTRMVEFESISERLYRVVRQASKETGKQVRLDLLGGSLEMDRGMLDRMMPAFEHLLRNCVSHGIEEPQARVAAGKESAGLITISLRQEGNNVSVEFSDDGAGLDLARIRQNAIKLGLMSAEQPLDDEATANLIFISGFSTAAQVTELAGRGVGMDVVRSDVIALGGRIETSTVDGKGSHFKLVLPLTTAVTQVVMLRAASLTVGVPANIVETVKRVSHTEVQQAYRSGTLEVGGEVIPFFWAGALLQSTHASGEVQGKSSPVVIIRSAAQRIALHVDEVLGNREVVVKNLGPQLAKLPGLTGMSVLPSGAVVLIYNPVALATVYGEQSSAWRIERVDASGVSPSGISGAFGTTGALPAPQAPQAPLVLVVDDSITVRRVTQRLLLRDGYRVALAADGLQALELLQEELPAVVLSDIEMPRMDGFDLARNIRADERTRALPIIMITSRIAQKHRDHASELGVNHYLGKPYSEDQLLRMVRSYCATPVDMEA